MFPPHPLSRFALDAAEISYIAAAVGFGVGVDELTIEAGLGDAQTIVVTYDRRPIHHKRDDVVIARFSQERDNTVIGVVKIDPIKSFVDVVELPQRRLALVSVVQMLDESAQTVVLRKAKKLPVKTCVVVPFVALTELSAHEHQMFAVLPIHPCKKHPDIGKLMPFVARHLG